MSHEIRANDEQIDLLAQSLEDWIGGDHPGRFMGEFVDALDLGALGFRERKSAEGRPVNSPKRETADQNYSPFRALQPHRLVVPSPGP